MSNRRKGIVALALVASVFVSASAAHAERPRLQLMRAPQMIAFTLTRLMTLSPKRCRLKRCRIYFLRTC